MAKVFGMIQAIPHEERIGCIEAHETRRMVGLGRRADLEAEVVDGLELGDRVVLSPSDRISDGVRVRPRR